MVLRSVGETWRGGRPIIRANAEDLRGKWNRSGITSVPQWLWAILLVGFSLHGCGSGESTPSLEGKRETPRVSTGADAWIGYMPSSDVILYVPGLLLRAEVFAKLGDATPLFSIEVQTDEVRQVLGAGSGFQEAAVSAPRKLALFGIVPLGGNPPLRTYTPSSGKLSDFPDDYRGSYNGFIVSPDGALVGSYALSIDDLMKIVQWQTETLQKKDPPPVKLQPIFAIIDLAQNKVTRTRHEGVPLCWSPDGATMYLNSSTAILGYQVRTGSVAEVSSRRDIVYAAWSKPAKGYVVATRGEEEGKLQLTDEHFKVRRGLGKCGPTSTGWCLSPNGRLLAYRQDRAYYILDATTGRTSRVPDLTGDVGPTWTDRDTIAVGDSSGTVTLVGVDGTVKRTFHIEALAACHTETGVH